MPLNSEQVEKALGNIFGYIDTINLSPYLKEYKYKTVYELMQKLEDDYPYVDEYSKTLFDGVSEDEFVDYLNKRCNLNIRETTVSYYYITGETI